MGQFILNERWPVFPARWSEGTWAEASENQPKCCITSFLLSNIPSWHHQIITLQSFFIVQEFPTHCENIAFLKQLKGERQNISLNQLENLCLMLKCRPNNLLKWHPSEKQVFDEQHPLFPLIRTRKKALAERIKHLPYEKLAELERLLDG